MWRPPKELQKQLNVFGAQLQQLREKRGWSQDFIADKIGVSQAYISQLEMGVRAPSFATQAALAKAFGMKREKFMEGV